MLRLDNNRNRLISNDLELLIDRAVTDESRKTLWKRSVINIRLAMSLLRKKSNYNEDEMINFQL